MKELPVRTEGALRLLELYRGPASGYDLHKKNDSFKGTWDSPRDLSPEYQAIHDFMWVQDSNPFWFADGIMYGLEQAWDRGLVEVVDGPPNKNLNLVYNPELVRDFLRKRNQPTSVTKFKYVKVDPPKYLDKAPLDDPRPNYEDNDWKISEENKPDKFSIGYGKIHTARKYPTASFTRSRVKYELTMWGRDVLKELRSASESL